MALVFFDHGDREEWCEGHSYAREVHRCCTADGLDFPATLRELRYQAAHTVGYVRDGMSEYIDELTDSE